jgi:hypothetical protein
MMALLIRARGRYDNDSDGVALLSMMQSVWMRGEGGCKVIRQRLPLHAVTRCCPSGAKGSG